MSDLKGSGMNGENCKKESGVKKKPECDSTKDGTETDVKSTSSNKDAFATSTDNITVTTEPIDNSISGSKNDSAAASIENTDQSKTNADREKTLNSDDQQPNDDHDIQDYEEEEEEGEYEYFEGEEQDGEEEQYMDGEKAADREGMEGQEEYYDDQYYNDGEEQFEEEDDEETFSELVPGPNGRMQYVVKGADGRIKCIMDAPPETSMPGDPGQDDNGEMREQGENEEQYADEEYYDDEEQGFEDGEVGQYEEGEIPQGYSEQPPGNYPNQAGNENYCEEDYQYMEGDVEGEEYFEEDEDMFDEEPTEEQLADLRKQYKLKQQYLQQQKQEELNKLTHHNMAQQKSNLNPNVDNPKSQQRNPANLKHKSPMQQVTSNLSAQNKNTSQHKTPPPQQNIKLPPIENVPQKGQQRMIPMPMGVSRNQNSQQSSQGMKDEEEYYEGMNEEEEQYDSENEDYLNSKEYMELVMQQRLRQAQNPNNFPQNQNQGEYYDDEECYEDEECYDDEEGEECDDDEDDDPAVEAYIQRAIEQKQLKEKQVQGLLQYRPKFTSNKSGGGQVENRNMIHPSNIPKNQNLSKAVLKPGLNDSSQASDSYESSQDSSPTKTNNILNSISMDNLSFKDKNGPIVNMVYLIRSNQGKDVYAMWDGVNFVPTPKKASKALPSEFQTDSDSDSKIVGGGGAKGKGGFLKGNATGLHMTSEQPQEERRPKPRAGSMVSLSSLRTSSPAPLKHDGGGDLLPNGRVWHHAPNSTLLARRPLHPESSNIDKDGNSERTDDGRNPSLKRPLENSEARYAACKSCGYSSTDLEKCERCARKFPPGTRFHTLEQLRNNDAGLTIDRKAFYGQKVNEQSQAYKYARLSASERPGGKVIRAKPSQKRLHAKPRRPLNVTVTISSDDEYSDSNETNNGLQNNSTDDSPIFPHIENVVKKRTGSIRDKMEDKNGKLKVKKGKGKAAKPPVNNNCGASLDSINLSLSARSIRIGSLKTKPLEPIVLTESGIECHVVCEREGSEKITFDIPAGDIIQCQGHLNPPVFVMFFTLKRTCGTRLRERLKMSDSDVMYFDPEDYNCKKKYLVIILDGLEDTTSLKQYLNQYRMINQAGTDFYEELSHEEANELLLKSTPLTAAMQRQVGMKRTLSTRAVNSPGPSRHPRYHDDDDREEDYNHDDHENNDQSDYKERSPTPPRITFSGPIEKLLTYPPPPTKFALTITNEDLYCLNEGEFLNDVIIDFYLKYLLLEKLSEKDKDRTHIFSSFFYKRLTQKVPKTAESSADRNKQPHIKRHSLVKTWTRHVDIFEKDFIVVPINEHSHWFLAIICFPGLEEPQFCPFLPMPLKAPESVPASHKAAAAPSMSPHSTHTDDNTSQDIPTTQDTPTSNSTIASTSNTQESKEEGETETGEEKEQAVEGEETTTEAPPRDPTPPVTRTKVITGIPLDPEKCIEESDNREYCLGKKQPCILVFDSLAGPSRSAVCKILKEYLQVEWDIKKGTERNFKDIRGISPKIPQQNNFSDCGIYVLQYVESFFECPIMDYSCPMKGLENWFLHEVVANKREDISNLVLRLKDLYPLKKS